MRGGGTMRNGPFPKHPTPTVTDRLHARQRRPHGPRARRPAARVECLEDRLLLAALVVNGGDGDDNINIEVDDNFIYAAVNNILIPQPRSLYDAITVDAKGGNDDVLIMNSRSEPIDVFPGTGADTIRVCSFLSFDPDPPPTNDLDELSARVFVHAGTDAVNDTLDIGDAQDVGNDTYQIFEDGPMKLRKPDAPGNESEEVWWGESNLHTTIGL